MKKTLQIAADYLFSADKELYNGLIRCGEIGRASCRERVYVLV